MSDHDHPLMERVHWLEADNERLRAALEHAARRLDGPGTPEHVIAVVRHMIRAALAGTASTGSASPTIPEAHDRADAAPMDAGPWHVLGDKVNGDLIGVGSDDFTRDVLLRVDGDFKCEMEKADYCAWLARTLNLNTGHSHCPHCGQWHDLKLGC